MLEPAPEVNFGLQLYVNAYWALVSCRTNELIPWTAVQAYCDHLGLCPGEAYDMHFLITRMDMAYLNWRGSKKGEDVGGRSKRPSEETPKIIQRNTRNG
jgi:hypothetical protein